MKLTNMSSEIYVYLKENGGKVSIDELCEATGRTSRSVGANVTDLTKKGLCSRVEEEDGDGNKLKYVVLTDEGMAFTPSEDE